jgi:hypothetical protein
MKIPGFTADASLYKTSGHYRMGGTFDVLTGGWKVMPQQRGIGSLGRDGTFPGPIDGDGGTMDVCYCVQDRTSSTGWRRRCCITIPPFERFCNPPLGLPGDEFEAPPPCGPCTCTCGPDCSRTCTQQCHSYTSFCQPYSYDRRCTP